MTIEENGESGSTFKLKDFFKEIKEKGVDNNVQHQQSLQNNKQDLDQTQEVDVKPSQFNLQHIDLTINNKIENYSGKITGITIKEEDGQILFDSDILIYFGSSIESPVFCTRSDESGNYSIIDLPPGFYTITSKKDNMQCISRNIKILPGETININLSLAYKEDRVKDVSVIAKNDITAVLQNEKKERTNMFDHYWQKRNTSW